MAVRKGPIRRWLGTRSPGSRFARLLAKPGFDPYDARAEVTGEVVYGRPGAGPECRGGGAVALPDRLDGTVEPAWIVHWSLPGAKRR